MDRKVDVFQHMKFTKPLVHTHHLDHWSTGFLNLVDRRRHVPQPSHRPARLFSSPQLLLKAHAKARHTKAEDPKDKARKDIALHGIAQPSGIGGGGLNNPEQVKQPDNLDKCGILEQRNEGVDDPGNNNP